ncbi:hypothetical protein G5714_011145 [Onychostoma macrolepis]|uniref:Uncharacterized protein n=1 Tax=Onychostoma macrolepis TaxID=369639 RepID=A0A7J6CMH8_9TELE|nr:hypothetical protein G5714_011145 [Onychostoma macrolepis]
MATTKEPESPGGKGHPPHPCACGMWISAKDSHGLCISCLGAKHAQASLSNPEGCPHCLKFSVKTRERRVRVAVAGKSDPCLSTQPREEPMDCPQASSSWGEMMERVLPVLPPLFDPLAGEEDDEDEVLSAKSIVSAECTGGDFTLPSRPYHPSRPNFRPSGRGGHSDYQPSRPAPPQQPGNAGPQSKPGFVKPKQSFAAAAAKH